ncbi:MAG: hypothetical protein ACYTGQ_18215, partial [Planctomycetota bacterium]
MSIRPTSPLERAALTSSITGMSPRETALRLEGHLKPKSGVLNPPELITGKTVRAFMESSTPPHRMRPDPVGLGRAYAHLLGSNVDL